MCRGSSINFSMNTLESPKLVSASFFADLNLSLSSFFSWTILIPLPPPPAEAFIIKGNPILSAALIASS